MLNGWEVSSMLDQNACECIGLNNQYQYWYWYLSNIDTWWISKGDRIFGIPELLFGSIPFYTIMIIGQLCLDMKVLTWYIDLDDIENRNIVKYAYPTVIKIKIKRRGPHWRYPNGIKKTTIPDQHRYTRMRQFSFGIDLLHLLHPFGIHKLTYCNFGMLQIATLIAVYANWDFAMMNGIGWRWAGVIWLYSLIFYLPLDVIKFSVRYIWSGRAWDLVTEQRVKLPPSFANLFHIIKPKSSMRSQICNF